MRLFSLQAKFSIFQKLLTNETHNNLEKLTTDFSLDKMLKKKSRMLILDRFHKGFVWTCIGMTFYGGYLLTDHFYKYFVYVKPKIDAEKEMNLQELLAEGSSERLAVLRDSATEIKA